MNPQSITAQLAPLRTPDAISWWPPAPGWWFVALLVLIAIVFLALRLLRFYRRGAPLRAARSSLEALRISNEELPERTTALAQLQRRLAIRIAGRRACAGLTGAAWAEFLNELARGEDVYFDTHLTELAYRGEVSQDDFDDALDATRRWVQTLERPA